MTQVTPSWQEHMWSIVIPTVRAWDGPLLQTAPAFEELATYSGAQLLLVTDLPANHRQTTFTSRPWTVVHTGGGAGYAGSCNRGLAQARGKRTLFVNDDVEVPPNLLEALAAAWQQSSQPGAVVPDVFNVPLGRSESGCRLESRWGLLESSQNALDEESVPDYPCGAAVAAETELLRRLGGWEEMYAPGYWEDADLGLTLRAAGLRIAPVREVQVRHLHGQTMGKLPPVATEALFERNRILCSVKHASTAVLPALTTYVLSRTLWHLLHRRPVAQGSLAAFRCIGTAVGARRRLRQTVAAVSAP